MTKTVEQLTQLVTDVLTGQRLHRKTRRGNCFHCGQPGHYKSKCPLRVKNFAPAVDTGILANDFQKENHCCLDVDYGNLKVDKEVFLLRTEGTGSCCQAGGPDSRKGVCVPGLTDKEKVADKGQGKEDCLVPLKEELQKEITKTQREAIHSSLLTKSDLVIQSSEDLRQITLVGHAGDNLPSKQPSWAYFTYR